MVSLAGDRGDGQAFLDQAPRVTEGEGVHAVEEILGPNPITAWPPEKLGEQGTRDKTRAREQTRAGPRSCVCGRGAGRSALGPLSLPAAHPPGPRGRG